MENRNVFKIRCNPYTNEIEYYWENDDNELAIINGNSSCFVDERLKRNSLKAVGKDIVEGLKEYDTGSIGMDVYFEGTEEDKEELQKCLDMYNEDHDIKILDGSMYLYSAKDIKQKIEDIFSEMWHMFNKYPNSEITESLKKYNDTVRETIPICVMGLYSAGKSAFINALLGVELLPSASDPTTAKTFKITSGKKSEIKFAFGESFEKNVVLTFDGDVYKTSHSNALEIIAELEDIKQYDTVEKRMYHAIDIINGFDMKRNKNVDDDKRTFLVSDLIEITYPLKSPVMPFDKYDFVIYDTPGSNSASNKDHTEVLKKAMGEQTNGLPIYVTTPDSMDSLDNLKLNDELNKIGSALDRSNLIVIVNKADDKDAGALSDKKKKFNELCISKLNPVGTYFVSSPIGLGCKKLIDHNTTTNKRGEIIPILFDGTYKKLYREKINSFEDEEEDYYTQLYKYNIIPQRQYDEYDKIEVPENMITYRNSGIHAVECAIAEFADKYAVYNKCNNAKEYLSEALNLLDTVLDKKEKEQNDLGIQLRNNMNAKMQEVLNRLDTRCDERIKEFKKAYADKLAKHIQNMLEEVELSINEEIDNNWINVKSTKVKGMNNKERITKRVNLLLEKKVMEFINNTSEISMSFWKLKVDNLKEELCTIITESPALSVEQRAMLKDAIMQINSNISFHINSTLQQKEIVNWLGFLKKEKAHNNFMNAYKAEVTTLNLRFIEQADESLKNVESSIKNKFSNLIPENNPKMLDLRNRLRECTRMISQLQTQKVEIELNSEKINELFNFKFIEKEEYAEV